MIFPELPYYLMVTAVVKNNVVSVEVESKVHKNRKITLSRQYTIDYVQSYPLAFREEVLMMTKTRYNV